MEYQEIQNRVKEILPEKRYEHTLRVVEVAKHLAKIHGANVEKAALAALVHDVCKPMDEVLMKKYVILHNLDVTLASDVSNPLYGEHGAAAVFGPQKGATTEMIGYLDRRARTFSRMASVQLGVDHAFDKGAGAAGGLGYAFLQFMNAKIQSGVDILFETINFDAIIDKADLIITGEGSADAQTLMGKLPLKVLKYGLRKNIPVVLIAGRVVDVSSLLSAGFSQVECVTPSDIPFLEAIKPVIAKENIRKTMFKL